MHMGNDSSPQALEARLFLTLFARIFSFSVALGFYGIYFWFGSIRSSMITGQLSSVDLSSAFPVVLLRRKPRECWFNVTLRVEQGWVMT